MPHYFDANPDVESAPSLLTLQLEDQMLTLESDRGVFSHGSVDRGTDYLLRAIPPPPATGDLADVGCGYGAIAIALAHRAPSARIWAVDVNQRALELTRRNAERAGITNVAAVTPDEFPDSVQLEAMYSNPPVRIGKPQLHELLLDWLGRLTPSGDGYLVVQRHLGSDSLAKWLTETGYSAERLGSRVGYRLLRVHADDGRPHSPRH